VRKSNGQRGEGKPSTISGTPQKKKRSEISLKRGKEEKRRIRNDLLLVPALGAKGGRREKGEGGEDPQEK